MNLINDALSANKMSSWNQEDYSGKYYVKSQSGGCDYSETKTPFFLWQGRSFFPTKGFFFSVGVARCLSQANRTYLAMPYPADHKSMVKRINRREN